MRSHYKQAMDSLALSPEARVRIRGAFHRSSHRIKFRPAVIAAAALVLILGGTAAAGVIAGHDLPSSIAQSLQLVRLSDTDQGITMTIQSAAVEDGVFTAYITMTDDRGGERLAQGVDFYDSYRINTPYRAGLVSSGCTPLGYDEASGSYGFLVSIRTKDRAGKQLDFSRDKFTFSVRQLLLGQTHAQPVSLAPDWNTCPLFSPDTTRYIYGGSGEGFRTYSGWTSGGEALVLQPGSWEVPVTEGVSISAAGFMGDQFHLQLRFDNIGPDDHGWLELAAPDGGSVSNAVNLSFRDEDGTKYDECVYDITPEELSGYTLSGEFTTGGYLLDGNWKVTFSLPKEG